MASNVDVWNLTKKGAGRPVMPTITFLIDKTTKNWVEGNRHKLRVFLSGNPICYLELLDAATLKPLTSKDMLKLTAPK